MRLVLAVTIALSFPSFAASPASCDSFIKAFEKAAGKPMPEDGRAFWKEGCLKEKDDTVAKQTKCLNGSKNDKDAMQCLNLK